MQMLDKGGSYNTTAFILDIKSFIVLAPDRSSLHKNTPFLAREMGGGGAFQSQEFVYLKKKFRPK
jgi:hypothetical protein